MKTRREQRSSGFALHIVAPFRSPADRGAIATTFGKKLRLGFCEKIWEYDKGGAVIMGKQYGGFLDRGNLQRIRCEKTTLGKLPKVGKNLPKVGEQMEQGELMDENLRGEGIEGARLREALFGHLQKTSSFFSPEGSEGA